MTFDERQIVSQMYRHVDYTIGMKRQLFLHRYPIVDILQDWVSNGRMRYEKIHDELFWQCLTRGCGKECKLFLRRDIWWFNLFIDIITTFFTLRLCDAEQQNAQI